MVRKNRKKDNNFFHSNYFMKNKNKDYIDICKS